MIQADWDDVDTSVEAGAAGAECAAGKARVSDGDRTRTYAIKHVSGRAGTVIVSTASGGPDPRPVRVACEMGPIRDSGIERDVVRSIVRRLEQLRNKDFAPLD